MKTLSNSNPALGELSGPLSAALRVGWWRSFFDHAEDAQLICTAVGVVEEFNRRALHLLGLTQGATYSLHLQSLFTGATVKTLLPLLDPEGGEALLGKPIPSVMLLWEGRLSHLVDLRVTPLPGGFGLLSLRDASRRWRLESHAQRLTTAMDASVDVVFITDPKGAINFANAAFQATTGYTIEESLGQGTDFLRAPGQEAMLRQAERQVESGTDWQGTIENRRSDGTTYTVEASISPVFDQSDRFGGYVCFERDVTQKRHLEEALRREKNFVRSLLDSLEMAIYAVDAHFCITYVNEGWRRMPARHGWLEVSESPVPGRSLIDYVLDTEQKIRLTQHLAEVLRDGDPRELSLTPGVPSHFLTRIVPWIHEGSTIGWFCQHPADG